MSNMRFFIFYAVIAIGVASTFIFNKLFIPQNSLRNKIENYIKKMNKITTKPIFLQELQANASPSKSSVIESAVALGFAEDVILFEDDKSFYLIIYIEKKDIGQKVIYAEDSYAVSGVSLYETGPDRIRNDNDVEILWWNNGQLRKNVTSSP